MAPDKPRRDRECDADTARALTPFRRRKEIAVGAKDRREAALKREAQQFACDEALTRLSDAQEQLAHSQKSTDWCDPAFAKDNADFNQAARAAYRAGHTQHPFVMEWYAARRSLSEWCEVRALKNTKAGLTAGFRKPMSVADVWLLGLVADMPPPRPTKADILRKARQKLRQSEWFPNWMQSVVAENERRALRAELRSRMGASRQAFEKWLRDLGIGEIRFRQNSPKKEIATKSVPARN